MGSIRQRFTKLTGANLLSNPLFNKGTAFTEDERRNLNILGLLPPHVNTLDNQLERAYSAFASKSSDIEKHIYLRQLLDKIRAGMESLSKSHAETISLLEAVKLSQATVLIGTSAQAGAFAESVIKAMSANCERPIIFPLSNPTVKAEATPADVLAWTNGRALMGTGSPFAPVKIGDRFIEVGQCNNSYIFPGDLSGQNQ